MKVSGLILRSFTSKNKKLLVRAFKTYVRPILEYCSPVWNPHLLKDINALEKVQRYFTKRLFIDKNISYETRLELTGLERLELRRLHLDLCASYSIIIQHQEPTNEFFSFNNNKTRAINSLKLNINRSRIDCRQCILLQ